MTTPVSVGIFPPPGVDGYKVQREILEQLVTPEGIRVNREKCWNCPFLPNNDFTPQVKRITTELRENPGFLMQCHNTFPVDVLSSVCRGGYDAIIADRIEKPVFVEPEYSKTYTVEPYYPMGNK